MRISPSRSTRIPEDARTSAHPTFRRVFRSSGNSCPGALNKSLTVRRFLFSKKI